MFEIFCEKRRNNALDQPASSHKLPSKARGADSVVEISDYEESEDEDDSSDEESGEQLH